jgi:quercetin dioxygenase-like cupin family protein
VHHSENIYVIEGEGDMTVGDNTFKISPGSYIFVPTNVVHSVVVDENKGALKVLSVQSPFFDGNDRVFEN